jgi:hypothetical protein
MGFKAVGRLAGRGLNGMRGYYKGGVGISTAQYGDTITFNIPGQPNGQIWLEQYVNGVLGYDGPFMIPMQPYTLSSKDQSGDWVSNAYSLVGGKKGVLIETSHIYVTGPSVTQPITSTGSSVVTSGGSTLPTDYSCIGSDGSVYTYARIQATRTALHSPAWMPAGCVLPTGVATGSGVFPSSDGSPGGGPGGQTQITINTAPSIPGALPDGSTVGASYNQKCMQGSFRFILATGGGFATGANRSGCSQTNSANCDPQFFPDLQSAIGYAIQNGEVPYKVDSAAEPWQLINCTIPPDPSKVYNENGTLPGGVPWLLLAGAAALYFFGKSRR